MEMRLLPILRNKAAQELYISQPAISKHIRELEGAYHVRLFERQGNRVALTPAGQLLLTHADRLLEMRNGQLSELTGEERDAASRDAVARTA